MESFLSFHLPDEFVKEYENVKPDWGFDIGGGLSLGELTFISKYSRVKDDGTKERWYETCRRCVEGMYSLLKDHCAKNRTPWNEIKSQNSARDAYERMFAFKWTPPGRGLANMGTPMVHKELSIATLINCAAVSTEKISSHSVYDATMPFARLMDMSMHGEGVGFDTRGAGKLTLFEPEERIEEVVIADTREGWSASVAKLLESYFFKNRATLRFDYSLIRPEGSDLKRFGGQASGPGPLRVLHDSIRTQLGGRTGQKLTSRDIVDLMNKIGKAVVAGGARRSALLSLGDPADDDYVSLKDWNLPQNAERTGPDGWAWSSNNSVYADKNTNLQHLAQHIAVNGEPGIVWLDVIAGQGRLADPPNRSDKATLVNPCSEIPLESGELCCLAELYPVRHDNFADFQASMKHAYMYAKAVVLLSSPWGETNEVITRNRRIGVSMTGIVEFIETRGWVEMRHWMDDGYTYLKQLDEKYSGWLGVRESIRLSTTKPAGSTSLLAGTTAGVHWPVTTGYFIRRMRFLKSDPLVQKLKSAGYNAEPDRNDPQMTVVVDMVTRGLDIRSEREVSAWEKVHLAAFVQRWWADNMVSVTVSFDKDREANQISPILRCLQGQLKSVSFLPISAEGTAYPQAPFEPIEQELGEEQLRSIKPIDVDFLYAQGIEAEGELYCDGDSCLLPDRELVQAAA